MNHIEKWSIPKYTKEPSFIIIETEYSRNIWFYWEPYLLSTPPPLSSIFIGTTLTVPHADLRVDKRFINKYSYNALLIIGLSLIESRLENS